MPRRTRLLLLLLLVLPGDARAQLLVDTLFTWQGYAHPSVCRVRLYRSVPADERPHTLVLQELAENRGPSTLDDARHLVELVGRRLGVDPAAAHVIFHWGAFSHAGAEAAPRKELFLRASFRRARSGGLATPSWRLVTRDEVEAYTDRHFPP